MARKIPMTQEGRRRETRRQRAVAKAAKLGISIASIVALAAWGYILAGG